MKNRRAVGLLNPMRVKNWSQEPGGRRDDICDHGLSRSGKVEVCENNIYILYIYCTTKIAEEDTESRSLPHCFRPLRKRSRQTQRIGTPWLLHKIKQINRHSVIPANLYMHARCCRYSDGDSQVACRVAGALRSALRPWNAAQFSIFAQDLGRLKIHHASKRLLRWKFKSKISDSPCYYVYRTVLVLLCFCVVVLCLYCITDVEIDILEPSAETLRYPTQYILAILDYTCCWRLVARGIHTVV